MSSNAAIPPLPARHFASARVIAPLAGSALLVALAIAGLPWKEGLFRFPRTPFDRSKTRSAVPGYILLTEAASVIPAGASVTARHEPPDAYRDTYLHRYAVALLPRRRVLPAALWGETTSGALWSEAEYFVVLGPKPSPAPGDLVLATPDGTVWRARKP